MNIVKLSKKIENLISLEIFELSDIFEKSNSTLYIVGGFNRDCLLNLNPQDIDICSSLKLSEVSKILSQTKFQFEIKNEAIGTARISIKNMHFEYATFRSEFYSKLGSHNPTKVIFENDINVDASRRDFYVNAIYFNIKSKNLIFPFQQSIRDISKKQLNALSRTPHSFSEDACRMLRLIKFAITKKLKITNQSLKDAKSYFYLVEKISQNRIKTELSYLKNSISYQKKFKTLVNKLTNNESIKRKLFIL